MINNWGIIVGAKGRQLGAGFWRSVDGSWVSLGGSNTQSSAVLAVNGAGYAAVASPAAPYSKFSVWTIDDDLTKQTPMEGPDAVLSSFGPNGPMLVMNNALAVGG